MKATETIAQLCDAFLPGSDDPGREFILSGCTYGDVYDLATDIRDRLPSEGNPEDAVCLYTQDKALVAAAVAAALMGGPPLILPYAFSPKVLRELREIIPFWRVLADRTVNLPKGLEIVTPLKGPAKKRLPLRSVGDPDRPFLTLFTGGSTGKPRLWSKTPRNILSEVRLLVDLFRIDAQDIFLSTVPPQHIYGLLFSVLIPFMCRARVLGDIFVFPREIAGAIERYAASVLVSVPVHYRVLKVDNLQRHALRHAFSSSGMLDEGDADSFFRRTGVGIHEIYGSTETGGIARRCRAEGQKSWNPFESVDWKVADDRLFVRSDFISGELERDADGFFMTGDRAAYDGEDRFVLLGRADGIVKVGGRRVDLLQVEAKLKQAEGVTEALVVSMPVSNGRENDVYALVTATVNEVSIRRSLAGLLEPYAIPRRIRIVRKIPVTPAGKYNRMAIERLLK